MITIIGSQVSQVTVEYVPISLYRDTDNPPAGHSIRRYIPEAKPQYNTEAHTKQKGLSKIKILQVLNKEIMANI